MNAILFLLPLLYLSQAILSLFALRFSHASITLLSGGDTAQKAARYSNKAALQVFHTKGTQGTGLTSLITSLILSLYLAISTAASVWSNKDGHGPGVLELGQLTKVALDVGEAGLTIASSLYIRNFWKSRAKVPMTKADDYNEAITKTNVMRAYLTCLGCLWGITGVLELLNYAL